MLSIPYFIILVLHKINYNFLLGIGIYNYFDNSVRTITFGKSGVIREILFDKFSIGIEIMLSERQGTKDINIRPSISLAYRLK